MLAAQMHCLLTNALQFLLSPGWSITGASFAMAGTGHITNLIGTLLLPFSAVLALWWSRHIPSCPSPQGILKVHCVVFLCFYSVWGWMINQLEVCHVWCWGILWNEERKENCQQSQWWGMCTEGRAAVLCVSTIKPTFRPLSTLPRLGLLTCCWATDGRTHLLPLPTHSRGLWKQYRFCRKRMTVSLPKHREHPMINEANTYFLHLPCRSHRPRGTLITQVENATYRELLALSSCMPMILLSSTPS